VGIYATGFLTFLIGLPIADFLGSGFLPNQSDNAPQNRPMLYDVDGNLAVFGVLEALTS